MGFIRKTVSGIKNIISFPGMNPHRPVDTTALYEYFQPVVDGDVKKAVYTENWWLSPPYGRPRTIDYNELVPYAENIWVRMIVSHIIGSVVQCNIEVVNYDDENPAPDAMIDEAEEYFTSRTWTESWKEGLRKMLPDLLLYDAGVFIKTFPVTCYDENLQYIAEPLVPPTEMVVRDGRSFLKETDLYGRVRRYFQYSWISPSAQPIAFNPNEIIYLSMNPQSTSAYGKSNLKIIKDVVDYLSSTSVAQRKMYENGLFPGGVINHADITDRAELKRNWQMYQTQLKGEKNFGKWMVTGGNTGVTPLQLTNQEMEWLDATKFFGKLVFATFSITPNELGFTDEMNRSTSITQSHIYKTNGIQNILSLIEEYVNREVVWKHFGREIKFQFNRELDLPDERSRADIEHVIAETEQIRLNSGIVTLNELREEKGLEKYDDEQHDKPNGETTEEKQNPWGNNPFVQDPTREQGEGARETEPERVFEKSADQLSDTEAAAVTDLDRWGSQAQTLLEAALDRFYDEGGTDDSSDGPDQ